MLLLSSQMDLHLRRGVMMPHAACLTSVLTKNWPCIHMTTSFVASHLWHSLNQVAFCLLAMTTSTAMCGTQWRPSVQESLLAMITEWAVWVWQRMAWLLQLVHGTASYESGTKIEARYQDTWTLLGDWSQEPSKHDNIISTFKIEFFDDTWRESEMYGVRARRVSVT